MKKILLFAAIMMLIPSFVFAASNVTFIWDPNTEQDLQDYRLWQSPSSGNFGDSAWFTVGVIPAGIENITISVDPGIWYWIVTARDTEGFESGPSNEVTAIIPDNSGPPHAPNNLIVIIQR